jgi:hypothetical protein
MGRQLTCPPFAVWWAFPTADYYTEVLELTSLTVNEFQCLVPPFEAAFQAHMAQ